MAETYIRLHETDNVAIALHQMNPGDRVESTTVTEEIPALHKLALRDIENDQPVYKYGQIIGYATADISAGSWVHLHNLEMGKLLDEIRGYEEISPPEPEVPIDDRYFMGFRNADGRSGTRNYIVIASTVDCSARAVEMAAEELSKRSTWLNRRYANVDGVIGLTHDSGCGLVAMSPGHRRQNLTMKNLLDHPNVGASVVVQLGCEKSQAGLVFGEKRIVPLRGNPDPSTRKIPYVTIQEQSGTWETVEQIVSYVENTLMPYSDRRRRELIPASDLAVALQCGGSDAASGLTANAAIGIAADLLVRCGASPFISETTETFGAERAFASRAVTKEVADRYLGFVASYQEYLARGKGNPQSNLSYGNKERGLTTIAEKSLGAVAKSGTSALSWAVDYGEGVPGPGVGFMNGPAFDSASATGQTAGGAQVGVFSTGSGSCFGGVLAPWIKVVSNSETFQRMIDMEIDAGGILDGTDTIDHVGRTIFEYILAAASGAATYSEKTGYSVLNICNSGTIT